MKIKFLFVCFLLISIIVNAQPRYNELSTEEYLQIKFEGVLFEDIKNTYGNISVMEKLLGKADVSIAGKDIGEEWRKFKYKNGFEISFSHFGYKDAKPEPFHLKSNNIFIKNVELNIGDSIEKLGDDIIFNNDKDGSLSIMFIHLNGDCCPIIIDFDQQTKKITSIEFYVWT